MVRHISSSVLSQIHKQHTVVRGASRGNKTSVIRGLINSNRQITNSISPCLDIPLISRCGAVSAKCASHRQCRNPCHYQSSHVTTFESHAKVLSSLKEFV